MLKKHYFLVRSTILLLSISGVSSVYSSEYREDLKTTNHKAEPFFRNGEAQKVNGFADRKEWIKHELWVETSFDSDQDGILDRMHVMVTRPPQTNTDDLKLPVVYVSSPYFSGIAKNRKKYFWDQYIELGAMPTPRKHPSVRQKSRRNLSMLFYDIQWVPRGYIMVYSSSPGTGLSDGSPTIGGKNETLAPKAVVEWLGGRANGFSTRDGNERVFASWCNGNVGMTGVSYNGTLTLAAATTGVKELKAIIPIAPVSNWYSYYRSNGMVRSPGGYIGEDMDVLFDAIHSGDKANRSGNSTRVRDSILVPGMDRITGDYNAFWKGRNYLLQMEDMRAAMLMGHSFDDWNIMLDHSISAYHVAKKMGLPVKLYLRPGGHGASPPFELMNKWFTKYLHGHENGIDKTPEVLILRNEQYSTVGYQSFPDEAAQMVQLHLQKGGNSVGDLSMTGSDEPGSEELIDDYKIRPQKLAVLKTSVNRLLYSTPQLKSDLRLSGVAKVKLRVKSSKPAVNLSVYLVSLAQNEKGETISSLVTRGWADLQNYKSIERSSKLKENQFYEIEFNLVPDDQILDAGSRLALMIFSSDQDFTLCPISGTKLTIDLDRTTISIPVVGGLKAFEESTNRI